MTVEFLPDLNPPPYGDVSDPQRPILSFAWRFDGPHRVAEHSHVRAHIIRPDSGALWVVTPDGSWLVPTGQAIWIAPRVHHKVYARTSMTARMLFVDPLFAAALPSHCGTVNVNPLLAQLLHRAVDYGNDYVVEGPMSRLAKVILDELATLEPSPLYLPGSENGVLSRVLDRLMQTADTSPTLQELAHMAVVSERTLARLFRAETGLSFAQWRTRLRLVQAVELLTRGESVTDVALQLGYSSASSFSFMFRTNLGASPGDFRPGKARPKG